MTQYMTPGLSTMLRTAITPVFWHTYTRTPHARIPDNPGTTGSDESTDAWGEQTYTPGTPVLAQECLYVDQGRSVIGPNGLVEVNVPVLLVPKGDPLEIGDRVSNIVMKAEPTTVVFVGPGFVENVTVVAPEFSGGLYSQALLRQITEGQT